MMARDIDNLAVQLGLLDAQQLLTQMHNELKSNSTRTVCRLQFLARISMAQMVELSTQGGCEVLCEKLRKLLGHFRFQSNGGDELACTRRVGQTYIGGWDVSL